MEATLGVKSQWAEQRIAQKPDIKIQFAQSEQDRSMPWEEVQRLLIPDVNGELLPVKFVRVFEEESKENKQLQVIYQAIISEKIFWDIVKPQRGMAIELFVGREIPADKETREPLQQSPLIRCRHAIQLPIFNTPLSSVDPKDFEIGNTVNSIEKLPTQLPPLTYQNPRLIKGWADYTLVDTADSVKLAIEWQHLKKQADEYNPIAAYRLYRADAYSPTEYIRHDDKKALLVQPELTFRTIPLAMYQANPSTIEVLGRVVGEQKILTDWQAQQLPQAPLWTDTSPTTGAFTPLSSDSDPSYPASPIWVLKAMTDFIKKMQSVLEALEPGEQQYRPVLRFHHPLEDRSPLALKNEGATPRERLDSLISNLNETIDPLGWWTLETLGLSCECHFEDDEGKRFDAKQLIKELRKSLQGQVQPYPFSVVFFLAEDGKTFLNVFRLIYSGAIVSSSALALPLGLRLKGRRDEEDENDATLKPEDLDEATLNTWLTQVEGRINSSMPNKDRPNKDRKAGQVIVYRYVRLGGETPEQKPLTSITLPIASNGLIHYELSVPDQWAHHYAIALEHLRRYDLVWQRLIEPTEQLALNAREIPYEQLLPIRVDRTLELVPHNVIALPCIGGIQSLVFVHPAAFAALASAVNATHGQYSGQHVFLERRINPDEKTKMLELYRKLLNLQQWELYQAWMNQLEPLDSTNPDKSPRLLEKSVALTEVPGTLAAIYGSDRYIYPDLPGYYEYRVAVYSTAGRVCSPIQTTPFISPIYDQPTLPKDKRQLEDEPRQQPQTVPCREVSFNRDNNILIIKIRLIHYRNHVRDEIKALWRNDEDSEDKLNVSTDTEAFEIDYGSLPDLYLTYQIYLRENPEEEDFAEPVLLPLAEIEPPLQKGSDPSTFKSKTQLTGVKHEENQETIDLIIKQASDNNGLEVGELYFQLNLDFNNPACTEALKKLRNYNPDKVGELIYLSVAREGVWSEIVTTTTAI